MLPHISICICTYKRERLLRKLLAALTEQSTDGLFTYSIVVADNDCQRSAENLVKTVASESSIPVEYCVESTQNIAMARNAAVGHARGDFLALIDDDEIPSPQWLLALFACCTRARADGVLGPVRPYFEHSPPDWIRKGRFCERPEHPTGYELAWRETRTGNVLLRRQITAADAEPFRRVFSNGGEDQEFFKRMIERGHAFVWCNDAVVYECVPPERCSRSYLIRRAFQRGQSEKHFADGWSTMKSLVAVPLYALMLPFLLPFGQHHFMRYLIRLCDHAAKLAGLVGLKPTGDKYVTG